MESSESQPENAVFEGRPRSLGFHVLGKRDSAISDPARYERVSGWSGHRNRAAAPGKKWYQAAAELSAVARHERGPAAAISWTIDHTAGRDQRLRTRNGLIGLLGPALVALLIACVDATHLMLSRGVERDGEFAVRLALGAARWRIVRQLLVEGAVVALVAGAAGALLSVWGIRVFQSLAASFSGPTADRLAFTNSTLPAAMAIAVATPIAVSVLPALAASRRRSHLRSVASFARTWTFRLRSARRAGIRRGGARERPRGDGPDGLSTVQVSCRASALV